MWHIRTLTGPGAAGAYIVGGLPGAMQVCQVGDRLGPQGAQYMIVTGNGVLCLEDIGPIGSPGGGLDWGIRVNSVQSVYYGGEGYIDIVLDGAGNASISAPSGTVAAAVPTAVQNDVTAQPADLSCGFIGLNASQSSTFSFNTGQNSAGVSIMVVPADRVCQMGCISFSVTRSDGQTFDAGTAPSSTVALAPAGGHLMWLRTQTAGVLEWTVTISNPHNIPCNLVVMVASDTSTQDANFFNGLGDDLKAQIDLYRVLPPLSGFHPQSFWTWWKCASCQAGYFIFGACVAAAAPEVFAAVTYRKIARGLVTVEMISKIVQVLKSIFQIDDGLANDIANGIIALTDPLTWPRFLCQKLGEC